MLKRILFAFSIFFVLSLLLFSFMFLQSPDPGRLNFAHRLVVSMINAKWLGLDASVPKTERALLDYDELLSKLNPIERNLADRVLALDPHALGFRGPFSSIEKPAGMVRIDSVTLEATDNGASVETGVQYFPEAGYEDFQKMMNAMEKDTGKRLYVDSGYRSPGRQLFLFFWYLMDENDYSLKKNIANIVPPGYSQHNDPVNTAMDLVNIKGINGMDRGQTSTTFATLEEFAWLQKNASKYNFYLSYPPGNPWGLAFEPWHWQYRK